jgi:hypothetical protein
LAVAYLISFGSLVVVVLARPFLNPSVNFFMTAALITQTLTLVYGLMLMVKKYAETQAVPKSEMNFFQEIIVLLNAVLFAIPFIEMFLRDVVMLLGGMMLKPVYSGEQETATIEDPRTFTSETHPAMILTDLVYTEQKKLDLANTQNPAGRPLIFDASDFESLHQGQGSSDPMSKPQFEQMPS